MRLLIISDIHSNVEALEACLKAAPEHDRVVNLGDIVGYGASPNEVTDRARALNSLVVRGNHDKACSGVMGLESFNPIAGVAALWTRQTLTPDNLKWLQELPQGPKATEGLDGVLCVHGSPLDEDEYVIVLRDAVEPLNVTPAALTFFGHTHIQGGFCLQGGEWGVLRPRYAERAKPEQVALKLEKDGKYLINPGSVGQPRDGDWRAGFALFDSDEYVVTFYRVPYDVRTAQQHITDAKLPERLATRLADGR